jgi:hypothetical protein
MVGGSASNNVYIVDASAWISIEGHPAQNLILFCVTKLIEAGKMRCPSESWREVKKCPWVVAWLGGYKDRLLVSPGGVDYLLTVGRVTGAFPGMSGARSRKERADQYVVATAAYLNANANPTRHVVVAGESAVKRPNRKIPRACAHFGVECWPLMEVLKYEFPNEAW